MAKPVVESIKMTSDGVEVKCKRLAAYSPSSVKFSLMYSDTPSESNHPLYVPMYWGADGIYFYDDDDLNVSGRTLYYDVYASSKSEGWMIDSGKTKYTIP